MTWKRTILVCFCAVSLVAGCDKIKGDNQQSEEILQARAAIDAYSKASERANDAHARVIAAFAAANKSTNLAEYRSAMRNQVLPRMNEFVGRLDAMQTGTPELKRVHSVLVAAYRNALTDIRAFVDTLQSPSDLERFREIRRKLQQEVRRYRTELDAYYVQFNRRLRGGQSAPEPAKAAPAPSARAATATGS